MYADARERRRTRMNADARKRRRMRTQTHADERNLKTRPDVRRLFKDFRDVLYI